MWPLAVDDSSPTSTDPLSVMLLTHTTRLGIYEIVAPLGANLDSPT